MLKKIMVTGILLLTIAVLNAKSITPFKALFSTPVPGSIYDELLNKIAADNDFKNYYISNVEFANKVIETKAGGLFLKYIQNTATSNEKEALFAKMNVSKKEFNAIGVKLNRDALTFVQKFPELKQFSEKEQKELLFNAFKKISADENIKTKFVKARNVTTEECFWWYMVCNTGCFIGCSYSNNECYWLCLSFCALEQGACWVIAN